MRSHFAQHMSRNHHFAPYYSSLLKNRGKLPPFNSYDVSICSIYYLVMIFKNKLCIIGRKTCVAAAFGCAVATNAEKFLYFGFTKSNLNYYYVSLGSKNRNTREPIVQISSWNNGKLPISGVIRCPFIVMRSLDKAVS